MAHEQPEEMSDAQFLTAFKEGKCSAFDTVPGAAIKTGSGPAHVLFRTSAEAHTFANRMGTQCVVKEIQRDSLETTLRLIAVVHPENTRSAELKLDDGRTVKLLVSVPAAVDSLT